MNNIRLFEYEWGFVAVISQLEKGGALYLARVSTGHMPMVYRLVGGE